MQLVERLRDRALQGVVPDGEVAEVGEGAERGRQAAGEVVHRQVELEHLGERAQSGRDVAVEGVSGHDQALERGEVADGGRERAAVAYAALQADSNSASNPKNRCTAVNAAGEVRAGSRVARVEGEVPGAHACGYHDGGRVQRLLHLRTHQ